MKTRTKVILGTIGAVLLLGPFLVPVQTSGTLTKEEAAAELWQGRSKFVEVVDHEVHYVDAGDPAADRLILLAHGFGASAFSYRDVLEPLAEYGFVIAYDRAAFGFTERPTSWGDVNPYSAKGQLQVIDELIEKFGVGKEVYLVGHSAGGALAAGYALEHQDKLKGLVLFAPAVYSSGGTPQWLNWIYDIPQLNHLGPLAVSSIATSGLELLDRSYNDPSQITDETLAGYTAPLKIAGWERAFWEFNKAPRSLGIAERLSEIKIKTLVITGDNDLVVPTENSERLATELPNADLVVIPQTGHLPNEEKPQDFAAAIIRYIQSQE
ncbi:MAG: alpha/beta hydrolase [Actinobacteria bacterium]|nr:alpha/beta hydrolase [Actinomycetota bacterium]